MTTVGEILRKKRLEKKATLAEVEKATKIRARYLEALEAGRYDGLPSLTSARGFVRNYASYLGLSVDEVLAFYRREMAPDKLLLPKRDIIRFKKFSFTPGVMVFLGTALIIFLFFAYLAYQYFHFTGNPSLQIFEPTDYTVLKTSEVVIVGRVDPTATLSINDKVVEYDEEGKFLVKIPLSAGLNVFKILATNKYKKESVEERRVRFEP